MDYIHVLLAMRKSRKRNFSFDLVIAPYTFYLRIDTGNMNQKNWKID